MRERKGTVGIVANPASGKDIRRLVAQATTVSNQEKIGIVRRIILGLAAVGVARILLMPDGRQLTRQATRNLQSHSTVLPQIEWLPMDTHNGVQDSIEAATLLRSQNAGCIVVLGGDGTVRAVSKEAGEIPILPVSTGTNNVLPEFVEGTTAGLAAGAVAKGWIPQHTGMYRHKWFQVLVDGQAVDRALVDVALLRGRFVGARAVWRPQEIAQILATRSNPASIGMSAVAGVLRSVTPQEPLGVRVSLNPNATRQILAPLGPGLLSRLGVSSVDLLTVGQTVELEMDDPAILALDGERELALHPTQKVEMQLRADGPWIVDSQRVMNYLANEGYFEIHQPV